jgi:uncharacterized protein YqeY
MLRNRLNDALKEAMKAKDQCAVSTLRLILAALKDRDICVRGNGNQDGISDEEILELLQKMVRQRHESIEQYSNGNRPELAKREGDEIEVIERFLPEPLDETDMRGAIEDVLGELDAKTIKDMGRVMGTLKERYPGRMDFGKASAIVKQALI